MIFQPRWFWLLVFVLLAYGGVILLLEGPLRAYVPSCPVSFGFCFGPA